jgi:hypothetical protein
MYHVINPPSHFTPERALPAWDGHSLSRLYGSMHQPPRGGPGTTNDALMGICPINRVPSRDCGYLVMRSGGQPLIET